jgi:hypothetical protein
LKQFALLLSKRNQFSYDARPVASARRAARRRLLRLRRATGCVGSSRRLLSTTPPRARSSSTTSLPPRVWVPPHITQLVTRLIAPLVVDYSASCRLVVDYCASAPRPSASALRAARHAARRAAHRVARCRLFRLAQDRTPRVLVPQHVARHVARIIIDYSASRRLVVDYFTYAVRPGASARRVAHRRLLSLAQARHRLLGLRRASGYLSTSRGSSRGSSRRLPSTTLPRVGSSSTTSPPPHVRVP